MEKKGQGAIEYLLIIGAAILVVAVVVIALVSITTEATEETENADPTLIMKCQRECLENGGSWDSETNKCDGYDWAIGHECEKFESE
ncbi:MAG: class III signal peptide-containing protein [Candidatus ainarchaeum sp.]|nr:class III signal peptide-containing protein [Candidatus ainarchaeum sp.]